MSTMRTLLYIILLILILSYLKQDSALSSTADKEVQRMSAARGPDLNRAIDALPFELHLPGYQFCGPGTHLEERLARGDRGINPLDAACREHDIAYSHSDIAKRHEADEILATKAWKRFDAGDATVEEKALAMVVWVVMKAKTIIENYSAAFGAEENHYNDGNDDDDDDDDDEVL
ncbi:PREDICTED: uncharacterized protein LOC105456894, partial [Wasmannia auropunctata]|uniref:uncharacterized protein LOC105456894 n=1 Tax=Wasmannia auropunctata TaxID=64793 RepID=UPI0005F02939